MAKVVKKRNWVFILYPESAPADWRERIQLSGVMSAISPLHDKDINPDGTPKKSHYHIILVYGSPTTYNNVKSFTDSLNQPIPQPLEQVKGYYRYFTHKDNPEKYQYSDREITTINGFSISDFVEITKSEVNKIKAELLNLIRDKHFVEYCTFMNYVQDVMEQEYFDIASSHTMFFNTYLKSARHSGTYTDVTICRNGQYVKINTETGEVIE